MLALYLSSVWSVSRSVDCVSPDGGVNRMAYGTAVNRNIDALSCQDTRTSLVGESNYATFGEDGVLRSRLEQAGSGGRSGGGGSSSVLCARRVLHTERAPYYDPASWLTYV